MRKNKKQLQSLTFFVGLLSLIERLIFVRGKIYDGVRFFLFFKKKETGKLLFYDTD